jgi:hypothetical protein
MAILSETRSRPVPVRLCELAGFARGFELPCPEADHGFLGPPIVAESGGLGFSMGEDAMVGAEFGTWFGATAPTCNMHTSAMTRSLVSDDRLTPTDAATVMRPDMLSPARLVIGEITRFPEIGLACRSSGPDHPRTGP